MLCYVHLTSVLRVYKVAKHASVVLETVYTFILYMFYYAQKPHLCVKQNYWQVMTDNINRKHKFILHKGLQSN